MIKETEFTIEEIAQGFHLPAFLIRHWIRKGKMNGYLFYGFMEDRVETEALIKFQKDHPIYQKAVRRLLGQEELHYLRISLQKKHRLEDDIKLIGCWEGAFDLVEELQGREFMLREYEKILERKYYPHPDLKKVREELSDLEIAMKKVFELQTG